MSFIDLAVILSFILNAIGIFMDGGLSHDQLRSATFVLRLSMAIWLIAILAAFYRIGW